MRLFIAFIFIFFFVYEAQSQETSANVSTPKGSTVTAWTVTENTNTWRAYYDAYYAATGRDYIQYFGDGYSSSRRFNCHGYGWHMVEGGAPRWIGWAVTTEEDIYMTDGSYVQVCNEMYPGKVSWGSGDHTAITTSTPGRWISKWNQWPLMEHDWNDTPFGTTNLKYYVSTEISGSNAVLCSGTRSLSARSISGASYTWYVSSQLSIVSGQGTNTVTVQRNGSSNGPASVYVEISTPCSGGTVTSKTFHFYVGIPTNVYGLLDGQPVSYPQYCNTASRLAVFGSGIQTYNWAVTDGSIALTPLIDHPHMADIGFFSDYVRIRARVSNACGYSDFIYYLLDPTMWFMAYPNPATNELTIQFSDISNAELLPKAVYLYHESSTIPKKQANVKEVYDKNGLLEGNKLIWDVSSLPRGIYYLHVVPSEKSDKKGIEKLRIILE